MNAALSNTPERVLGWDLLRGLCAIAVATYHLLSWQNVAAIYTWGSYGVYLFFVLSGASLTYNYADSLNERKFSFTQFLWIRYMRLAPLYVAVMLIMLPWKLAKNGATTELAFDYISNATMSFGFYQPSTNAVVVGGWSLGIEAVFYLLFPVFMQAFRLRGGAWALFLLLSLTQMAWIGATLGRSGDYASNAVAYHHGPAFAAYFMGGCLLGMVRRRAPLSDGISGVKGLFVLTAGFGLFLLLNPSLAGDEITGWRGLMLFSFCFALVDFAGRLKLQHNVARLARLCGDATYGVYLLHPVLFFGLVYVILPRFSLVSPVEWTRAGQLALLLTVLLLSFVLALVSEKYFEKPMRSFRGR
ncbi:MAG: acyltransferase family protein [Polaromonas sp.]|jgi:peptidoglycan/LPS O-acetylase OafA/YrhL|nr:acyltransferase family protein [Polaromonas sp.]